MPATFGYSVSVVRATATVNAILDGPTNFIDTARIYGEGRSEERLGAVLRERGGLPVGFVLSTKIDRDPATGVFDAAQARRSLETSLRILGVNVSISSICTTSSTRARSPSDESRRRARRTLPHQGGGPGQSRRPRRRKVELMIPLLGDWDFDAVMTHNRFTLVNRNAEPLLALAAAKGIAVMNAAPYASGVLAKGSVAYPHYAYQEADDAALAPIRRVEAVAARYSVPLGAAALQFSLRDKRVTSTVCGVTKPERVKETLDWARLPIPRRSGRRSRAFPSLPTTLRRRAPTRKPEANNDALRNAGGRQRHRAYHALARARLGERNRGRARALPRLWDASQL